MKVSILTILAVFFTLDLTAQVIFRNDFIINGKQHKVRNMGLTNITINLGKYPNWSQLINGRGGRTLVIDVRQLTHRKVEYTYTELAERVYVPPMYTGPVMNKVPLHLIIAPPNASYPAATFKGLNLRFRPTHL